MQLKWLEVLRLYERSGIFSDGLVLLHLILDIF